MSRWVRSFGSTGTPVATRSVIGGVTRTDPVDRRVDLGRAEPALGLAHLVGQQQRDDDTGGAGAGGAARAVQVGLGVRRRVVVQDQRDVVDVDAARGDVRGDEHRRAGVGELLQRALARRLGQPAVDGLGLDAGGLEVLGQPVDAELGAGEDDRPAGAGGQLRGDLQLVAEGQAEGQVLGRRGVVAGALDLVPGRVLEVAADQACRPRRPAWPRTAAAGRRGRSGRAAP